MPQRMPAAHDRLDTRSAKHDPGLDHDQQHQRDAEDVARNVRRGPRTRLLTVEMDVVVFVSHAPPTPETRLGSVPVRQYHPAGRFIPRAPSPGRRTAPG